MIYILVVQYTSKSQLARVSSESWMTQNGYCLACSSDTLVPTTANTQARDFECKDCGHPYELKSTSTSFGKTIVDGAYASMMRRIENKSVSSFLLMQYSPTGVNNLIAIHQSLITREVIQERKPLSSTARRAGWIGCNILLRTIPPEGRITIIRDGIAISRERTRSIFAVTARLNATTLRSRSWSRELLICLHRLHRVEFSLKDAYKFEEELSNYYPENRNVRAKIRQQLQVLRDAGLLSFEGRGVYRLAHNSLDN